MASARQFERFELDSVVSVPLLDRDFLFPGSGEKGDEDAESEDEEGDEFSARVGLVALRGTFSVASSNKLTNTISADNREHEVVILDFTETIYIDDSAALVVEQLIDTALEQNTDCIVLGLSGRPAITLNALDVLRRVPAGNIVATLDEARAAAAAMLR